MVQRETLTLVISGMVMGVPVAVAGDRLMHNMLFGLESTDLVTLASATIALLLGAAIASVAGRSYAGLRYD